MGYCLAHGLCIRCRQVFSFNPMKVPSIVMDGTRRALCRDCIEPFNEQRRKLGLPLMVPLPGAYEPCHESELEW